MNGLRDYLRANMFDGNEDGTVKMSIQRLLDEVTENVLHFLIDSDDRTEDLLFSYYGWTAEQRTATDDT